GLAFGETRGAEGRQIDRGRLALDDPLGQALADRRARLERGAAVTGHGEEPVVLRHFVDDWAGIRAHHQDTGPVAAHRAVLHRWEAIDELLTAELDVVLG